MPTDEQRFRFLEKFKLTASWDDEELTLFWREKLEVRSALCHLEGKDAGRGDRRGNRALQSKARNHGDRAARAFERSSLVAGTRLGESGEAPLNDRPYGYNWSRTRSVSTTPARAFVSALYG
jgi:hypothetical protein